jgi:DNA-binding response OmpR family regulator
MGKQVLLVDDDPSITRYLSVALSEHGYDPVCASNGKEGLDRAMESKPDLIVLDVMMPGKSGFVLFKALKKDEQLKDVPVLMLTGVSEVLEDLESRKDETFNKPYEPLREALRRKVQELREEGLVKPEMFVDKPVDPDSFIVKVRELIGS